jgi:RHS repeat-associated protein
MYKDNDPLGRLSEVDNPDGGKTTGTYNDTASPPNVVGSQVISSSLTKTTQTNFDGLGRSVQKLLTSDWEGTTHAVKAYDSMGRLGVAYNPTRCSNPPTTNCGESTWGTTQYGYDALGRNSLITQPDNSQITSSYFGNCTTAIDEAGHSRRTCTDGLGRLTRVWEDPSGNNFETDYQYDALDNLLCVHQKGSDTTADKTCTDPSLPAAWRPRNFVYDSLSRLTSATNPESGTITYKYDADGNLLQKTSPQANQTGTATTTISYCYDALNRVTGKAYTAQSCPMATPVVSFLYDQTSYNGLTITNGTGRRTGMSDPSGSTAWSFDPMGRVATEQSTIAGITKAMSYTYFLDGELSAQRYPGTTPSNGALVNYQVTAAGRPFGASGTYDTYVPQNAKYTPDGQMDDTWQHGTTPAFGGILTHTFYSNRLQPVYQYAVTYLATQYLFKRCYDFHLGQAVSFPPGVGTCSFAASSGDNGNPYLVQDKLNDNRTQNFFYDSLNRIQQANTNGTNWGQSFTIDAWSNLTNVSALGGKTLVGGFNAAPATTKNQLTGYSYDAAGNLLSDGLGHNFTYDAENRISVVSGSSAATYTYDGDGTRVQKSGGTLYWTGPGSEVLAESDLKGNISAEYIYFNGKRSSRVDLPSGKMHYFLSDLLGSSRLLVTPLTQATVTVEEDLDYTPYGIVASGSAADHYLFTGKERDSESGLDNFGKRYHASTMGRFMTPDPIGIMKQKLRDPQQWNMYSYSRNNPLRFMDPTGMYVADCGSGVKNCDKQIQNLDKSLQNALKSKDPNVVKAAQAYGKLGDANGVNVSLVKVVDAKHPDVTGTTGAQAGTGGFTVDANGKVQQATQVNIKAGMGGSQLEETAVHEGVHVEDRENFVNTITPTTYDRNLNITHAQSERNAYGVENEWLRLGNMPTRNIDDILAHPPYSDNPDINKPLFGGLDGPQ